MQKISKTTMKEVEEDVEKYVSEFKEIYEDSIKFLECQQKSAAKKDNAAQDAKKKAREKAKWLSTHNGESYEPGPDTVAKAKRYCQNDLSVTEEQRREIEKMIIGRKYHRPVPKDFYIQHTCMCKIVGHDIINGSSSSASGSGNNDHYVVINIQYSITHIHYLLRDISCTLA